MVLFSPIAYSGTLFGPRPLPKIPIAGMTFSNAILWSTLNTPEKKRRKIEELVDEIEVDLSSICTSVFHT